MIASRTFEKYEGLGNDFLVVEAKDERDVTPEQAAILCDRRLGVGGDGVLLRWLGTVRFVPWSRVTGIEPFDGGTRA